jgi:alpha-tubulin suppressor-like RCC1 family protein
MAGSTLHGKLGLAGLNMMQITKFQPLTAFGSQKVKQVACGDYHTLCLTEEGEVYSWGGSLYKKLASC